MSFNKNFLWGVSGAAPQQDGGYLDDGKGLNIWDAPLSVGHIRNNDDCHVACDHYHKWKDDFKLLKKIGVNCYRFSISPARIYPIDENAVNEQGIKYYVDMVTELNRLGIEPMCTLYHWDMPLWLHERGGWKTPLAVEWFERYVKTVVNAISDKVQYWITFNEPQCFVGLGYKSGCHAPFEKLPLSDIKDISRNVMLAHGRAVKVIRDSAKLTPKITFAPTSGLTMPTENVSEEEAYNRTFDISYDDVSNTAWWADPIVLGKAPKGCDWLSEQDLSTIHQPLDFFAYNIYNALNSEFGESHFGPALTTMGWPVTPECMYWAAKFFFKRYKLPLMITENGMANMDFIYGDGKIHDPQRAEYLRTYLENLKKACDENIPIIGYSYWSFMDNFEWAEGYFQRFGLVYVDYKTQERILKDSAYFYHEIIKTNGENL